MDIKDIMTMIKEVNTKRRIKFEVSLGDDKNMSIDVLDLPTRGSNALKSSKIFTLNDLVEKVNTTSDLQKYNNIGVKTRNEIMTYLLAYVINKNIENGRKPLAGVTLV